MPKYCKNTLYFSLDSQTAVEAIKRLCEEFPEIKLIGMRKERDRPLIYYDIKYPLKIKGNLKLYFENYNLHTL